MTEELKDYLTAVLQDHIYNLKTSLNNSELGDYEIIQIKKDIDYANLYLDQLYKIETFD